LADDGKPIVDSTGRKP